MSNTDEQHRVSAGLIGRGLRWIFRALRWLAALGIAVYLAIGFIHPHWRTCTQVLTPTGGTQRLCRTAGATDGISTSSILVILLLLAPDISEAAIPGLLSIKRRLKETEHKAEQQEARQLLLQGQIHSMKVHQEVHVGGVLITQEQLNQALKDVETKQARLHFPFSDASTTESEPPTSDHTEPLSHESVMPSAPEDIIAQLGHTLIIYSERLRRMMYGTYFSGENPEAELSQLDKIQRFRSVFDDELQIVTSARAAFVHGKALSVDELTAVVALAERLIRIAISGGLAGK